MKAIAFFSAFLLAVPTKSADIDLFESANVLPSTVDSLQPPGSVSCDDGRNGSACAAICINQNPQNPFEIKSSDQATIRTAISRLAIVSDAEPLGTNDFGFSTLVKFDKFRDGSQTLFSIQSQDGAMVYFRINLVATAAQTATCLQCKKVKGEIEWRTKSNQAMRTEFDEELLLDDREWHYLYVNVEFQPSSSDLSGVPGARITFYEECTSKTSKSVSTSQFLMTPPSGAIVLVGMARDGSGVIHGVRGCMERTLFRKGTYNGEDNRRDYCKFSPCLDCRTLKQVTDLRDDSDKLREIVQNTDGKITDCLKDPVAPADRTCGLGCTFEGGINADVGQQVVVKKAGDKVCRICKCLAPEDFVCYDYCSCSDGSKTYYDGETYRQASDNCMECTCASGSESGCQKVC